MLVSSSDDVCMPYAVDFILHPWYSFCCSAESVAGVHLWLIKILNHLHHFFKSVLPSWKCPYMPAVFICMTSFLVYLFFWLFPLRYLLSLGPKSETLSGQWSISTRKLWRSSSCSLPMSAFWGVEGSVLLNVSLCLLLVFLVFLCLLGFVSLPAGFCFYCLLFFLLFEAGLDKTVNSSKSGSSTQSSLSKLTGLLLSPFCQGQVNKRPHLQVEGTCPMFPSQSPNYLQPGGRNLAPCFLVRTPITQKKHFKRQRIHRQNFFSLKKAMFVDISCPQWY